MSGLQDPLRFIKAEEFFGKFPANTVTGPTSLVSVQSSNSIDPKHPLRYAALLTFNDGTNCLFQFATPQLWRIRYKLDAKSASDYPDANTRTVVQDSFAALVDGLQGQLQGQKKPYNAPAAPVASQWGTTLTQSADQSAWILSSVQYQSAKDAAAQKNGVPQVKAYFHKDPFHIQCTRVVRPQGDTYAPPPGFEAQAVEKVIWQTSRSKTFSKSPEYPLATNIVLNVAKPGPAEYVGFGEQGGHDLLKAPTLMNYFCYDNLGYSKVYGQGPLDDREPLYHSQPFFMELNGTPGHHNVTATLVDNYSQVFVDLGKTNAGRVALGIRFGVLDTYIMVADKVSQLIWLFTSIVGRPQLKPRFVLGHHQGGYGYERRDQLETVVSSYHSNGIPLDGLHIDVDFQHKYRTFTTDDAKFPNVAQMFANFKANGVKCCTNITPIISFDGFQTDNDPYPTINAAWDPKNVPNNLAKNYLIPDYRYEAGQPSTTIDDLRYLSYDGGNPTVIYAKDWNARQTFNTGKDLYNIYQNYNSGFPFHGGVSYGNQLGIAGFYPDLNRKVVREQFWALQYKDLFDKGLEFVWQDMTTPAVGNCYGDMLGFPGRLKISSDPYHQDPNVVPPQQTAIELWALYSYNLHKATYKGLQNLPSRKGKRNFIIGRGSSTGMHRYAGLWTGDNRSTWDFWRICVAQVLSCGLGGITIAGVDMGGFFPDLSNGLWCDPNLFVRWYSGAFLLPWYRNHYMGKVGQTSKLFQEVYKFATVQQDYPQYQIPDDQKDLYASVEPICKYYVRLRYSLMQALYDRMFENLIDGLPIARSMFITDPDDTSLFNEAAQFVNNQYLLGHHILVCPIFQPDDSNNGSRDIYLPRPNNWYAFNLRIDQAAGGYGVPLSPSTEGGSVFSYYARITSNPAQFPYITPIYIREGAFIPQIDVRLSIGDGIVNPIVMHVYPGRDDWYSMYLDDGVSRDSAPGWVAQYVAQGGDSEAKGVYRDVRFEQKTTGNTRTLTIHHKCNNYDPSKEIGPTYTIVLWQDKQPSATPTVTFQNKDGNSVANCDFKYRSDLVASVFTVPIDLAGGFLTIKHVIGAQTNGVNGLTNGQH